VFFKTGNDNLTLTIVAAERPFRYEKRRTGER